MQDERPQPNSVIYKNGDGASPNLFHVNGLLVHGSNQSCWYYVNLTPDLKLHFEDWHLVQLERGIQQLVDNLEVVRCSRSTVLFKIKDHQPSKSGKAPLALDQLICKIVEVIYHTAPVGDIDWNSRRLEQFAMPADDAQDNPSVSRVLMQHEPPRRSTTRYRLYDGNGSVAVI